MSHPEPRSRVTVEDLLRLKRAERPEPEFWTKFEAELRQKQLAALVERRRWWESLPQLFARRAYVPIGAAAVLTFTLVSVRNYTPTAVVQEHELTPTRSVAAELAPRADIAAVAESNAAQSVAVALEEVAPEPANLQLSEQLPAQTGDLVPWSASRTAEETPSARSIAKNVARLEQTEPELMNALLPGRVGETSDFRQAAAQAVEIAAISAVSSRRSRLLAQFADRQFTQDPTAPEVVRERHARRLGNTELTGGWTRVGVKADRVSLKF
ncbi:MAG: hypothetical protein C0518_11990 [Opitutus sp.]|nr:hypothetical protein [Opitutus sp.]